MSNPLIAASGFLLLTAAPAAAPEPMDWNAAALALQQQVTHVPRVTVRSSSTTIIMRAERRPVIVEKKGTDCVKVQQLAGFSVNRFDSVDLVLKDGSMLRAKLGDNCPALGFYNGFYIKRSKDDRICAGRDAFRSRSGRSCAVQAFVSLGIAR